jgi:nucleotide-binding universal stress UspA family protein
MSYAALMVYVDNEGIPEQRVRIASELAKKFDAALIGFSARAVPPLFVSEGVIIEEATEADIKQMQVALGKRGDWFRGIAGVDRQDIEWRTDANHLFQFALDEEADLLVAGAYGHSRLGEWMSGGMTREVLASSPLCCLMSH